MSNVQLPEGAIRDTVAAVFSDPAYHPTSLLGKLGGWLLDQLREILLRLGPGGAPTSVLWTLAIVLLAILLGLVARMIFLSRAARFALPGRRRDDRSGTSARDPRVAAQEHAARGDYTAAAHSLYAAMLDAAARRGDVDVHESKTIGDYLRELAFRSSARLPRFRDFARIYETVIYGIGFCDRERYERLSGLAHPMVESGG